MGNSSRGILFGNHSQLVVTGHHNIQYIDWGEDRRSTGACPTRAAAAAAGADRCGAGISAGAMSGLWRQGASMPSRAPPGAGLAANRVSGASGDRDGAPGGSGLVPALSEGAGHAAAGRAHAGRVAGTAADGVGGVVQEPGARFLRDPGGVPAGCRRGEGIAGPVGQGDRQSERHVGRALCHVVPGVAAAGVIE